MIKRKLSVIEHLAFSTFEKENVHFTFTVGLRGIFELQELRSAIAKVRSKHPLLSSRIEVNLYGWSYFVPDNIGELPLRVVDRKGENQWRDEEWKELHQLFDLRKGPLARFVCIKGDDKSELIFICHHIICDGLAAGYVIRDILHCLDKPDYLLKPYKMLPGISKLLPKKVSLNPLFHWHAHKAAYQARQSIKRSVKNIPAETSKKRKVYNTEFTIVNWEFNVEQSQALIRRARAEGVSVHTAFHIASLEAFAKTIGKSEIPPLVKVPVDVRSKLSPKLKEDSLGTSFAIPLSITYQYKARKNFWDMAREIKQEMAKQSNARRLYHDIALLELLKPVHKHLIDYLFPVNENKVSDFTLSNLGKLSIPVAYERLSLDFLYVVLPVIGNMHLLIPLSLGDKMFFSFVASKDKMDENQAGQFRNNFIKSLEQAIKLGDSEEEDQVTPKFYPGINPPGSILYKEVDASRESKFEIKQSHP